MLEVKFDISGVDNLCNRLVGELKKTKGAKAGYIKDKKYENGFSLIQNALTQEYGATIPVTPKMRAWFRHQGIHLKKKAIVIPPRPFLRNALKDQKLWCRYVQENFDAEGNGTLTLRQLALRVALLMRNSIINSIGAMTTPANSGFTLSRKKPKTHPLINTHTLADSVQVGVIKGEVQNGGA